MNIPLTYAIGLAAVLLARELFFVLPGSGTAWLAVPSLLLMGLPALVAGLAVRRAMRRRMFDGPARWLARAGSALLPLVYLVVLVPCGWLDLIDTWSGDSHAAGLLLLLSPLAAGELLRLAVEARAAGDRDPSSAPQLRGRIAFVGVFTAPWLVLGVLADLLQAHHGAYTFVVGTSAGLTLGAILFVVGMGVVLPLVFRFLFGLRRDLPDAIGEDVRTTAAALGFPGRSVMWLDSGMRHVNALMLGPLPWPRYLVLTDGLMAALDLGALRGVVAHEVGHAQAGHPALLMALFVITPLLLANVTQQFEPEDLGDPWSILGAALVVLVAVRLLRRVAHRFEHEADVLSAIALGGAEPCISALQRVGQVVQQEPERASMLHPSESARVRVLRRFAADPVYRARFTLRGLRLRRAIGGLLLCSAIAAVWSWYRVWPYERAVQCFGAGDFAAASELAAAADNEVTGRQWQWWHTLRENLDAAIAIAGDGGDWDQLRPRLAAEGWRRGVDVLRGGNAVMARPWFALATEDAERSPIRRCMLLYCEAARDADSGRMATIAAHIERLGCPPELRGLLLQ